MTYEEDLHDPELRFWACDIDENIQGAPRKALIDQLTAAGFEPTVYGFKTRIAAEGHKQRVKEATGIELELFKHDDEESEE